MKVFLSLEFIDALGLLTAGLTMSITEAKRSKPGEGLREYYVRRAKVCARNLRRIDPINAITWMREAMYRERVKDAFLRAKEGLCKI